MKTTISPSEAGSKLLRRTTLRRVALRRAGYNGCAELKGMNRDLWITVRVEIKAFYDSKNSTQIDTLFNKVFNNI